MSKKKLAKKQVSETTAAVDAQKNQWSQYLKTDRPDPLDLALKTKFVFSGQRCPRCNGLNTIAVSTQGRIQYRQCRAVICRHKYAVRGKKV